MKEIYKITLYIVGIQSHKAIKYFQNADALYLELTGAGVVGKTIPNKLTFYVSQRKPIIASINGDGRSALESANVSIICDSKLESIKGSFVKFNCLSKKEKEIMAINNYKYYKDNFENKRITENIEVILKELVG